MIQGCFNTKLGMSSGKLVEVLDIPKYTTEKKDRWGSTHRVEHEEDRFRTEDSIYDWLISVYFVSDGIAKD